MRDRWSGLLGVVVACVGCGDREIATADADLIESMAIVRFDVTGAAVGAPGGPEATARASWQAACDAWVESMHAVSGEAAIEGHDCGTATDIGGNDGWHFTSTPVAHVAARVAQGTEALAFEPGPIAGNIGPRAVAYASWQAACDASLSRVKAIYGDRLLAGTCQPPKDIGGSDGWLLSSALSLWIAPAKGALVTTEGWIAGSNGPRAPSLTAWRDGCDAWLAELAGRSDARFLDAFSCGEATDVGGSSGFLFVSPTAARFAFPLADGSELTKQDLGSIQGTSGPRVDAIASWQQACSAALGEAKADAGDRYLAGVCHEPKDIGSSGWQYASPATVWVGDLAKTPDPEPEPGPGPDDSSGDDLKNSPEAAKCKDRCVVMMDTCDAGPVEQTCDGMCAFKPTEAQMKCAEATSCDELQDWSLKCLLFQ